jgi:hypothetical protein
MLWEGKVLPSTLGSLDLGNIKEIYFRGFFYEFFLHLGNVMDFREAASGALRALPKAYALLHAKWLTKTYFIYFN